MLKTAIASTFIVLAATCVFWHETDGFSAFTLESSRRVDVARNPRPVPAISLQSSDGDMVELDSGGLQPTLIEFIYTSCPTICFALGEDFYSLQETIARNPRYSGVRQLSISFDLERDTPAQLAEYAKAHGARTPAWRIVRPRSIADLRRLLDVFGIVVKDDGAGGFVHNAALHLVDARGRLARIGDVRQGERILSEAADGS